MTVRDVYNSGDGGAAPTTAPPAPTATPATVHVDEEGVAQRIPFRGLRRKIADALSHSLRTAAHFGVTNEADVTRLDRKRKAWIIIQRN